MPRRHIFAWHGSYSFLILWNYLAQTLSVKKVTFKSGRGVKRVPFFIIPPPRTQSNRICYFLFTLYSLYLKYTSISRHATLRRRINVVCTPGYLRKLKTAHAHLTLLLLNRHMPCLSKQCRSRSVGF